MFSFVRPLVLNYYLFLKKYIVDDVVAVPCMTLCSLYLRPPPPSTLSLLLRYAVCVGDFLREGGVRGARMMTWRPSPPEDASRQRTKETPWLRRRASATCFTAWASTTGRLLPCLELTPSEGESRGRRLRHSSNQPQSTQSRRLCLY